MIKDRVLGTGLNAGRNLWYPMVRDEGTDPETREGLLGGGIDLLAVPTPGPRGLRDVGDLQRCIERKTCQSGVRGRRACRAWLDPGRTLHFERISSWACHPQGRALASSLASALRSSLELI